MKKKIILSSVLAIVMCLSIAVGATYAWFTDSANTNVNKIQAGTLDVVLEMYNPVSGEWEDAEGKTLCFRNAVGSTDILWEPGVTFRTDKVRVRNNGNLSLKFKVIVSGITGSNKLLEVIEFTAPTEEETEISFKTPTAIIQNERAIFDFIKGYDFKAGGLGALLGTGETYHVDEFNLRPNATSPEFRLVGKMSPEAGNEYQGLSIDDIAIIVLATQTVDINEKDSIDENYDENATYSNVVYSKSATTEDVNAALAKATSPDGNAAKDVLIDLKEDASITLNNGIVNSNGADGKGRNVTFVGNGTQTVDVITNSVNAEGGQLNYQRGSSFTFKNVTIAAGEGSFDGIVCDNLVFEDCKITGKLTLYGSAKFVNCVFDNTMADQYSIWTWGGTHVTFEGCTFNTNGKAILLYGQATAAKPTNLVINKCTFNDRNSGSAGKAAIEVGNDYNATYTLTVNETTVNGFATGLNTGSNVWANKNNMDAEHLTVTIDGVKVQ